MPHRPERPGNTATATSPGVQASIAAHIMRPTSHSVGGVYTGAVGSLMNHPIVGADSQKPWLTASASNGSHPHQHQQHHAGIINRPMTQSKSNDSADNRSTTSTKQDDCTVATLATEGTAEEDRRDAVASALLMVSTQPVPPPHLYHQTKEDTTTAANTTGSTASSTVAENAELNTVPLKKRKKHLDFLRKNQDEEEEDAEKQPKDACHVSPISHSTVGCNSNGRTVSKDEVSPERPTRPPTVNHTSSSDRGTSFDSKESPVRPTGKATTQALLDSSKILSTTDIGAPPPTAHVVVPHFPSVLHQVLSSEEFGDSVMQWLPDGESWKVLRWDALRRQVLPKYFSDLRDEHGRGSGTIDAFLWHLTAWGFEEIKDGTDVGAYRHDLFIRGAQKLCSKMRFTAVPTDDDSKHSMGPNTVSPARIRVVGDRTLLQVPSLNAIPRPGMVEVDISAMSDGSPAKRPRYVETSSSPGSMGWPHMPSPYSRPGDHYASEPTGWSSHYYSESPHMGGLRSVAGTYAGSSYDPRLHTSRHIPPPPPPHPVAESVVRQSPLHYSPPQVRSGRGSLRITNNIRRNSPITSPVSRPAFPVSNRGGKGSRKPASSVVCRPSSTSPHPGTLSTTTPTTTAATSTDGATQAASEKASSMAAEAHRIGSSVQGVAVAISRKTKRKLPMAMAAKQNKEKEEEASKVTAPSSSAENNVKSEEAA